MVDAIVLLPWVNGPATMGARPCYHGCTTMLHRRCYHGRHDGTATMGARACYHGCTVMLPWSTRRRCYHGSTALLPWVHGDATMDAWRCNHGLTALLPWVAADSATGPRRSYPELLWLPRAKLGQRQCFQGGRLCYDQPLLEIDAIGPWMQPSPELGGGQGQLLKLAQ
jgi:hypothetical protein